MMIIKSSSIVVFHNPRTIDTSINCILKESELYYCNTIVWEASESSLTLSWKLLTIHLIIQLLRLCWSPGSLLSHMQVLTNWLRLIQSLIKWFWVSSYFLYCSRGDFKIKAHIECEQTLSLSNPTNYFWHILCVYTLIQFIQWT